MNYQWDANVGILTNSFFLWITDLSLEIPAEFQVRKSKTRDPQVCQLQGKDQILSSKVTSTRLTPHELYTASFVSLGMLLHPLEKIYQGPSLYSMLLFLVQMMCYFIEKANFFLI